MGTTSTADLRNVASNWADDLMVRVLAIQSVRTTDKEAYRLLTGQKPDPADVTGDAYWLVQVHATGAFECECSVRGKGPPRFFDYLVRASDRTDVHGAFLLTDPIRLTQLGKVTEIRA